MILRRGHPFSFFKVPMENQPSYVVNNNPFRLHDEQLQLIQFGQIEHGLLAGVYELVNDVRTHRRECTVAQIVSRWPAHQSVATESLVQLVCQFGYLEPSIQIDLKNRNRFCRLAWGLARALCGVQLPFNRIEYAVALAMRK